MLAPLTKPDRYRMKQLIADLMYQVLIELIFRGLSWLAEWVSAISLG